MRVHRNLNRRLWSVTVRGQRVRHVGSIALADVTFIVSAAGRARVLRQGAREVHAWAEGRCCLAPATVAGMVRVSYSPFRGGHFATADGAPVRAAALAAFAADGSCWVRGAR